MFQSRQQGLLNYPPCPFTHVHTRVPASHWEGGREGAGRAGSPDISRVRKWVGLEHEFIYFRPTSGIKGDCSQGTEHSWIRLLQSPESFVKEDRHTPASGSTQPTTAERQPTRANHKAPLKVPGRRKASLLSHLSFK